MPKIHFLESKAATFSSIDVEEGGNLMKALLTSGRPVASSCDGDGVCGKCRLKILKGQENLSAPNSDERRLQQKLRFSANERLSCQVRVLGDIQVDADYW